MSDAPAAPPLPEDPPMEIHKPKPIHSWRDFLKEVGIIVLGVSIALAAEQTVENWREHRQYLEAREAVRQELNSNLSNLRRREAITPCLAERLEEIGALLDRAGSGQGIEPAKSIPVANTFFLDTFAFGAASQAGRASLFPQQELHDYGQLYTRLQHIADDQVMQASAWTHLAPLRGKPRLSPEMALTFDTALEEARTANRLINQQLAQFTDAAAKLGIKGDASENPARSTMCTPITAAEREPALLYPKTHR
jgi:hypothetical protein